MSINDRARGFVGRVKLSAGKAFGSRRLRVQGRSDRMQAKAGLMASKLRGTDKHDQPMN